MTFDPARFERFQRGAVRRNLRYCLEKLDTVERKSIYFAIEAGLSFRETRPLATKLLSRILDEIEAYGEHGEVDGCTGDLS